MKHDTDIPAEHARNYFQQSWVTRAPQERIDETLQALVDLHSPGDERWALYASHCFELLYRGNLKSWLKRINELLLGDADRTGNQWIAGEGCARVFGYFLYHASWDSNPEEYGIVTENLPNRHMDYREEFEKIKLYPFASKSDWEKTDWRKYSKSITYTTDSSSLTEVMLSQARDRLTHDEARQEVASALRIDPERIRIVEVN